MHKLVTLTASLVLIGGCAVGPDYQAQTQPLPEQWPGQQVLSQEEQQQWQDWWTRYQDPVLNQLVERAMDDNLELQLQAERIAQARAELGLSRASRWPTLSAQANATREKPSEAVSPTGDTEPQNQFAVSGVLNYELDLWGKLRREREAAGALLEQSVYGADAVRLNLVTEVVTTYFNLRSAQQQLRLAEQTLESRRQSLELEELRYQSGAANPLSVQQARAELESTRALIPSLRRQVDMTQNALAVLVGYTPKELLGQLDFGDTRLTDIRLPDSIPSVMPSELLRRRPDIRAAEAQLMAATSQIGVAVAKRLPSFNLTGLIGSVALDSSNLFMTATETWRAGADIVTPLFDAGRLRANVKSAEARRDQAEIEYQITISNAFREVRDALTLYNSADERVQAVRRQTDAIAETLELAELRYEEGAISFYELLDAQRLLLDAELNLSDAINERLAATATLFKAMGGGWGAESQG